nr:unnamed protein product [Ananas comosus var. bracteatus]
MPVKEIDEAKLFVGYLPHSMNTDKLIELFLPFGGISDARVITDKTTGLSRGFGFVKYADPICAAKAVARMNGYRIEGKVLAVRIAHLPPTTVKGHLELGGPALPVAEAVVQGRPSLVDWPGPPGTMFFSSFAKTIPLSTPKSHLGPGRPGFPVPEAVSQGKPASLDWPGPPGSMLPQPFTPFTDSLVSFSSPRQILVSPTFVPGLISSQNELEQFPGYLKSFDSPAHVHYSSSSDASWQFHSAQSSGWNQN